MLLYYLQSHRMSEYEPNKAKKLHVAPCVDSWPWILAMPVTLTESSAVYRQPTGLYLHVKLLHKHADQFSSSDYSLQ